MKSLAIAFLTLALAGCGIHSGPGTANPVAALTGQVHGGQQPVSGATIQLYAAASTGYAAAATPLLTSSVVSGNNGQFSITGDYTCPTNALVYLTATGGNPGLSAGTNNAALAMMAALGPCAALTPSTFVNINELTTVAAVWPLARFMSGGTKLGASATNAAGLLTAFNAANTVVNVAQGTMPGASLPSNATLPTAEIDTLANILAACVNSAGGAAGDQSVCGKLFTAATPSGGAAPTDTLQAAVDIARNPAAGVAALFALTSSASPYQPSLATAPQNFLIGIRYTGGGLSTPSALAVDQAGDIWIANRGNSSVTELAATGALLSPTGGFTGGGLNNPSAIAVQTDGSVWLANQTGNSVSHFATSGTPLAAANGGGLSAPRSVAIDGDGNLWLANSGNSSVSAFTSAGVALSPTAGYTGAGLQGPVAIAIDPH